MLAKIFCAPDSKMFLPIALTGESNQKEWRGKINEEILMYFLNAFPKVEITPWKEYQAGETEVIGIEIALEGYYHPD